MLHDFKGIENLLVLLRSLYEKVGTYEEEEELQQLEKMLQSSTFKKAKEVSRINFDTICNYVYYRVLKFHGSEYQVLQ